MGAFLASFWAASLALFSWFLWLTTVLMTFLHLDKIDGSGGQAADNREDQAILKH